MVSAGTANVIGGRYLLVSELASGGMASVHVARHLGPAGFSKLVALKRMHPHLAREPEFVSMFLDEARLAAQVRHANVVPTLDVVNEGDEILLVMDYVLGESLSSLMRAAKTNIPVDLATSIAVNVLEGLHAAHEASGHAGRPLGIVHRDVSPQNIMVGVDGTARVLDFGIAKAKGQATSTREGEVRGKVSYMSPEQYRGQLLDRRADVYAAGVVLWEMLTGRRLFVGDDPLALAIRICTELPPPPSQLLAGISPELDAVVLRALAKDADARYATAHAFADALEHVAALAPARAVARWVDEVAGERIAARARAIELAVATPTTHKEEPTEADPGLSVGIAVDFASAGATAKLPSPAKAARRRRRKPLAIALAVVGTLAVTLVAYGALRAPAPPSSPPPTAAEPPAPAPEPAPPPTPAAAPPTSAVALSASPAATTSAPRRRPPPRVDPPRPPAPAPSCQPPWRLTPEGLRELKPECR